MTAFIYLKMKKNIAGVDLEGNWKLNIGWGKTCGDNHERRLLQRRDSNKSV